MKKIKQIGTIAFLALALAYTLTSCSSDSDGSSTGGLTGGLATAGTIKGNVDGTTIITDLNTTSGTIMGTGSFIKHPIFGQLVKSSQEVQLRLQLQKLHLHELLALFP